MRRASNLSGLAFESLEARRVMAGDTVASLIDGEPVLAAEDPARNEAEIHFILPGENLPVRPSLQNVSWVPMLRCPIHTPPRLSGVESFSSLDEYAAWLENTAVKRWAHLLGQRIHTFEHIFGGYGNIAVLPFFSDRSTAMAGLDSNTGATGVQVNGVDEADIVEVDGDRVFIGQGRTLTILGKTAEGTPTVLSRIEVGEGERIAGLYVSNGRVVMLSTNGGGMAKSVTSLGVRLAVPVWPSLRSSPKPQTTVTVLDATHPESPELVQQTSIDGRIVASRMVDNRLRLVLEQDFSPPEPLRTWVPDERGEEPDRGAAEQPNDEGGSFCGVGRGWGQRGTWVYETQDEYVARVRHTLLAAMTPHFRQLAGEGGGSETDLLRPEQILQMDGRGVRALGIVAEVDVGQGTVQAVGVPIAGDIVVHGTRDAIFVLDAVGDETTFHEFTFEAGRLGIEGVAEGRFEGRVLNEFAVDVRNGQMRVAVTTAEDGHGIRVLSRVGTSYVSIGSLSGLAPDELVYAVRFTESHAFLVTFRQIDPLFVIDLTVPETPTVVGELKIDGFSDVILPIGNGRIATVGRAVNPSTGFEGGLQVSIFDVSDPRSPRLTDRYLLDGDWLTTPVSGSPWVRGDGDTHALSWFDDLGILAFPVTSRAYLLDDNGEVSWEWQTSIVAFRVDEQGLLSRVVITTDHGNPERLVRCGNWLIAVGASGATLHDAGDPSEALARLDFAAELAVPLASLPIASPAPPPDQAPWPSWLAAWAAYGDAVASLPDSGTGRPSKARR
jgi:hypothetical protein